DVCLFVLRSRAGNGPSSSNLIEFGPSQLSDLFATLTSQRQQLNDPPIGVRHLSCAENNGSELLIGQHPIATIFPIARGQSFRWRKINDGATNAPSKEGF